MRVGSLFAGIGGFDLGFERAGMQTAWQVELDGKCRELLAARFPGARQHADVRECGAANLDPVDVICGGFPCQDLSVAGKRAGLAGERSGLFYEMTRITDELQPSWLVWENVPGLLSSHRGSDFAAVLVELERIGYHGAWSTLDARYFGVAQRRRRIFGVFARGDSGAERAVAVLALAARLRGNPAPGRAEGKEVADEPGEIAAVERQWPCDVSPTMNANYGTKWGLENQNALGGGGLFVPVVGALHTASGRASTTTEDANQLVPTVTSKWAKGSGGPAGSECSNLVDDAGVRRLTPTECERLQGFPDGWTEGFADTHRYRMLGNAVAVPCAAWIGKRLMKASGAARGGS